MSFTLPALPPSHPLLILLLLLIAKKLIVVHWYLGVVIYEAVMDPPPQPHGVPESGLAVSTALFIAACVVTVEWYWVALHSAETWTWWQQVSAAFFYDGLYWTAVTGHIALGFLACRGLQYPTPGGLPLPDWRTALLWIGAMVVVVYEVGWMRAAGWMA